MARPGTVVLTRDTPPPRSAPTETGVWFVAGLAAEGPTDAQLITSLDRFTNLYGDRIAQSNLSDAVEAFFQEGGTRVYVARVDVDDPADAVDADFTAALAQFDRALGPGQVSIPGRTTAAAHAALLAHADATNRIALLDAADTPTVATLTAAAGGLRADPNARYGALLAPWGVAPGLTAGTTRDIPLSPIQAALIARSDATGTPNQAAAGVRGESRYLVGLTQSWTDDEREDLNDAGVNVTREVFGGIRAYGYRTLVDPDDDPNWVSLGTARLFMAIRAKGANIAERYVFAELDGRGRTLASFAGDLVGMLVPYFEAGSLYGDTPADAFIVDVGTQINTPERLANRELHAVISLRVSPFAELVVLEIANVPTTEVIAA